ncbi:hypothetical protein ACFE04_026593 [Oxalis oulophora]
MDQSVIVNLWVKLLSTEPLPQDVLDTPPPSEERVIGGIKGGQEKEAFGAWMHVPLQGKSNQLKQQKKATRENLKTNDNGKVISGPYEQLGNSPTPKPTSKETNLKMSNFNHKAIRVIEDNGIINGHNVLIIPDEFELINVQTEPFQHMVAI